MFSQSLGTFFMWISRRGFFFSLLGTILLVERLPGRRDGARRGVQQPRRAPPGREEPLRLPQAPQRPRGA